MDAGEMSGDSGIYAQGLIKRETVIGWLRDDPEFIATLNRAYPFTSRW
jgi:hypothetical protein